MAKTNWGAGLQALGQGLAGIAELQYQKQREAQARQQQLSDVESQRAWLVQQEADRAARENELYNQRNPMATIPSGTVNVPSLGAPGFPLGVQGMSNPAYPQFLPPGMDGMQVPQDTYLSLQSRWMMDQEEARRQAERDAGLYSHQAERDAGLYSHQAAMNDADNAAMLAAARLRAENSGGGSQALPATDVKLLVQRAITDEERGIWGDRWAQDTEMAAQDLVRSGYSLGPGTVALAKELARQVNPGMKPDLSFGMARAEIPGQGGQWYNPALQRLGEVEQVEQRRFMPDKKAMAPGIVPIAPIESLPPNQRAGALAAPLADSTFVKEHLVPALGRGALRKEDLKAAIDLGLNADELNRIIGYTRQAQAQPDTTDADAILGNE